MSETNPSLHNADPLIETADEPARERALKNQITTYNRFMRLMVWFVAHVLLLLAGLYALTLGGSLTGGLALIVLGLAALVYGIVSAVQLG